MKPTCIKILVWVINLCICGCFYLLLQSTAHLMHLVSTWSSARVPFSFHRTIVGHKQNCMNHCKQYQQHDKCHMETLSTHAMWLAANPSLPTRVLIRKQDSNKQRPWENTLRCSPEQEVLDNPLHHHHPQLHLNTLYSQDTHAYTHTSVNNTPSLLGSAAGGNWDVTNQSGPWQSTSCPAIMSSRRRQLSQERNDDIEQH